MRPRSVLVVLVLLAAAACGSPADGSAPLSMPTPRVVATIEIGRARAIDVGQDGVWTANYEDGTISLIDPGSPKVVEEVRVERALGSGPSDIHIVGNHVWIVGGDANAVGHFDPGMLEMTHVVDAGPAGIVDMTASPTEVWLAQHSDMKGVESQTVEGAQFRSANEHVPPPGEKFSIYSDIASGDVGVWAVDESEGTLAAISPSEGTPRVASTGEGAFTGAQADVGVGLGYVWVETSDGSTSTVARFDPETSDAQTVVLDGQDGVMAIGPDAVWVFTHRDEEGLLWRLDPDSISAPSGPTIIAGEYNVADIAYGFGSVWVTHDTNLLTQIDVAGGDPTSEPVPSPEARGDADVCGLAGPWVDCPEARWLRRVMDAAGLEVTGDTGTALEVSTDTRALYAWNAVAARPVGEVAADEGYEPIEGTKAFSNGHRLLWEAQDLHMYMSVAHEGSIDDLLVELIDGLIAASESEPMSADLAGAKAQPSPTGEQRFETSFDGQVRVWPITEDVANEGKYLFMAPHCGLDWMLDFDASFWKAVKPNDYGRGDNYPFFYNSDEGAITFTGDDTALYQASTGERIRLERLPGSIIVDPCA